MTQSQTVRVATCHDPAEATLIGTVLEAHGIAAMIPSGASSAGVMAVGFITHVFVHADDAEQAAALIAEMRAAPAVDVDDDGDDDDRKDAEGDDAGAAGGGRPEDDLSLVLDRRKRVGGVILMAVMIQFGTAHMTTGAWRRGIALAVLELTGIAVIADGNRLGLAMVAVAVVLDAMGAVLRVRRLRRRSNLPVAQLRGSRSRDPR